MSAANAGDLGSIPGLRRSPGERNGYPLQYSGLENSMDYSMGFSREEYWSGLPYPLQWIFSTQGSNPGLLHCRQILNHLSHPRSPGGGAISLQNMLNVTCLALFQEPIVPEEPSPKDSLTWEPMSRALWVQITCEAITNPVPPHPV